MKVLVAAALAVICLVAEAAQAQVAPAPGSAFRDCDNCPEMVVLPAGSFLMGSPPGEAGRGADEGPVHRITIAKPFAVGKFELSFAQWDACAADGGCGRYRPDSHGWPRPELSVRTVNWNEAKAYVTWLSAKTGKEYRLLSEAEWEYAARAGTTTPYPFGTTVAAYVYQGGPAGDPVSAPNAFGLVNMNSNLIEWVEDRYHPTYAGAPENGEAWTAGEGTDRVLRGGTWNNKVGVARSAMRGSVDPVHREWDVGFRVARSL